MIHSETVQKLTKDIKEGTARLSEQEIRFLVDNYYSMQDFRIQASGQKRAASESGEPHALTIWMEQQFHVLEREVHKALAVFAESKRAGRWALLQHGIGPVITAGLLAHIDIRKAPTAGHIWSFAGLTNEIWREGEKRPWNAKLKVLCWKIGVSFMKQSGSEKCYYGHVYRDRKKLEVERNEAGMFKDQAEQTLATRKIKDPPTLAAYKAGKLPAGRLELRAERYATKLFLSHFHSVLHESVLGTMPPKPYVIEHLGHAHLLTPPGWPCE